MAVVRFANLEIVDDIFMPTMLNAALELNALIASGIAVAAGDITAFLSNPNGGRTFNPRHYNPLTNDEPNISSDDPDSKSTPKNLTGSKQTLVRHSRNQSWSSMDLVAALNGNDPVGAIRAGMSKYWQTATQNLSFASLLGLLADNVAHDNGDMLIDLCAPTTQAAIDVGANVFAKEECIDALATLGDHMGQITGMGVHSMVYARMLKNDLIDFVPDSATGFQIAMYGDKRVIVDDGLTPTAYNINSGGVAVPAYRYTTVLFGAGALGMGMGSAKVPLEVLRDPTAGDGGGQETIFSRVEQAVHPYGFEWLGASMVGASPTNAEIKLAANWNRTFERKRIPLAFIQSNG